MFLTGKDDLGRYVTVGLSGDDLIQITSVLEGERNRHRAAYEMRQQAKDFVKAIVRL